MVNIDTCQNAEELELKIQENKSAIENLRIFRNEYITNASVFTLSGSFIGIAAFHEASIIIAAFSGLGFFAAAIYGSLGYIRHFRLKKLKKETKQLEMQKKLKR